MPAVPCPPHGLPPGAVSTPGPHKSVTVTASSPSCSQSQFKVVSLSLPTFCWRPFLSSWPRPAIPLIPGSHAASWLRYLTWSPGERILLKGSLEIITCEPVCGPYANEAWVLSTFCTLWMRKMQYVMVQTFAWDCRAALVGRLGFQHTLH